MNKLNLIRIATSCPDLGVEPFKVKRAPFESAFWVHLGAYL